MHESSYYDKDGSSSDDEGQGAAQDRAKEKSISKMMRSKQKNDIRFINMLKV